MRATQAGGRLVPLDNCFIQVGGMEDKSPTQENGGKIAFKQLPDISDTKSADYADENVQGRATSIKTYSHSSPRQISITIHCVVTCQEDIVEYISWLRLLQSLVYPSDDSKPLSPVAPPKVCQIKCGLLLSGMYLKDTDLSSLGPNDYIMGYGGYGVQKKSINNLGICCVLKSYNVKFPIDVAWDEYSYLPWKFDIDTSWEAVYSSDDLPTDSRIRDWGG